MLIATAGKVQGNRIRLTRRKQKAVTNTITAGRTAGIRRCRADQKQAAALPVRMSRISNIPRQAGSMKTVRASRMGMRPMGSMKMVRASRTTEHPMDSIKAARASRTAVRPMDSIKAARASRTAVRPMDSIKAARASRTAEHPMGSIKAARASRMGIRRNSSRAAGMHPARVFLTAIRSTASTSPPIRTKTLIKKRTAIPAADLGLRR